MERPQCPHVRTLRRRLDALCKLASDLPEEHGSLRTALDDLATDWDTLLGPCSIVGALDDLGAESTPPRAPGTPVAPGIEDGGGPCPRDVQHMHQTMLDQSHAQLAYLDSQFNFLAVNAAYAQGSGYRREELVGRNHFSLFPHPENEAIFTQARDSGKTVTFIAKPFVFPNRLELGTTYWDWILVPIKGVEGVTCGLVLSLTDVTPREVARQALAESDQRYRLLVDTMAEGLASLDMNGRITFVNDEFCRMLGYARDELISRHHLAVVHAQHQQQHKEELARRTRGQPGTFETVLIRKDGSPLPVIQAGRPLRDFNGRICGTLAAFTDISARKMAELALAAERDFVSAVLDTANALVVVLDSQGRITRFNRACERLTGYTFDEVRGQPFWDLFLLPEEMEDVQATFGTLWAGNFPNQRENHWVTKDGAQRRIAWSNTAILDAEGAVHHIVATGIDVTAARQAEEEIRSLARFPGENPNAVLRISRDGTILYANEASQGLLTMWATRVGHPLPSRWRAMVTQALKDNQPRTIETQYGDIVYSVDLVPIAEADYTNLYARDITERARAQADLQMARDGLEERVRERTGELEGANQALEAMSLRDRRQRLAAEGLLQATLALTSSLDLDQVLDRILEQTRLTIHCPAVAVIPVSEEAAYAARQRGLDELEHSSESLSTLLSIEALYGANAASEPLKAVLNTVVTAEQGQRPFGLEWVRSYVAIPLQVENRLIGSLCAFSDQADAFQQETLHLMEGFAAHAAAAIHNAALYEATLRARALAENLADASVALTRTLDLESVMDLLLDHLYRLVPYDGATIALMRDRNSLAIHAIRGQACSLSQEAIIDVETNAMLRTLLEAQQSVLIDDIRTRAEWTCQADANDRIGWLGVPMVVGKKVIGVCELCRSGRERFTREHVQMAEGLLGQAAVAIQNAWLFGQVRAGQDRLQALSRRLVEVQEAERRYIARELHDEAAQVLISIKLGLGLLERQAEQAATVRATVGGLRSALDGVLENLSRLTTRLRPVSLDHLGLDSALRQFVEQISNQHELTAAYESLGLSERLAPDVETALYRIIQEALSNVVRHAHATRVDVLLERRDDLLKVLVEDNGVGFDVVAAEDSHSLGLAGMRERAEMLGGAFAMESSPGRGTTVLVEVPYGDPDTHRR